MSYRSHEILQGPGYANVRALYKADGYAEEELKRPIIGIANAYNSICPGHIVLRQMAERIREGIQAAGGMPIEFGTIGACDGIAMGHEGMRYILPAREMIANDVEAMVQAHRLDGIVLLGSCDKIIPGMLIGAMRVNLPAIFINGGPSLPGHMADGNPYGGEWIDHSCIQQSEGALQAEKITEKEFKWIEDNAMPTVGSCAMLGTANTMGCLAEAMGIMLPGSATIPAVYSKRMAAAYNSGKAIVDLVHKNIRIQDIITKRALANAIMVNSAMGGSTNAVLHLLAIAHSGKINLTIDDFETISSGIQHLVAMIPAGKYTLFDFFEAGGVQALMKEMEEKLYVDALTCTGDSPIAVDAFHAGKHVMCEKPMAINTAEAEKMMTAWKESGKKFSIGYQNRYRADVRHLRSACQNGDLGEIYYAKAYAIRRRGVPTWGSFIQGSQQGGGPLIDIGTHSLDLALWLMDNYDVESVTGTVFKKLGKLPQATDGNLWGAWDTSKYDVEDSAIGYIKMKSGALVVLESSWALNILEAREAEVTLCGTKAGAELRNQKEVIYNRGKYGRLTEEVLTPGEPHDFFGTRYDAPYLEAKEWLTAILEDRDPLVRPEQSLVVTQVLDAIYESAAKNETVWF